MDRPTLVPVGLPKGRFEQHALGVLERLGAQMDGRTVSREVAELSVHLLKARDIPGLVRSGQIALGVASDEWIAEAGGPPLRRFGRLGWCQTKMCLVAVDEIALGRGSSVRIATEYPVLTAGLAKARGWDATIIPVSGSTEALVPVVADAAVECVETGATLAANGLKVVEVLYHADMYVIGRADLPRRAEWRLMRPVLDALLDSAVVDPDDAELAVPAV